MTHSHSPESFPVIVCIALACALILIVATLYNMRKQELRSLKHRSPFKVTL